MATVIEAEGLTKRFGATQALAGIDLTAESGQVLALLGPNGAGKTTAVRILSTLLRPDGGRASICGYDVVADAVQVRQLLALTGQYASVDEELTGSENLIMICRLLGLSRPASPAPAPARCWRASTSLPRPAWAVKTYSGGMRRRLDLAASLLGDPEILFLDEPTTGLDPRGRSQMWDTIRAVLAGGATVLLTTQYLEEADELASQIAVIDHGRVVASGTPAELKARTGSQTLQVRAADRGLTPQVADAVAAVVGTRPEVSDTGLVTVAVTDPAMVPAIVRMLDDVGIVAAELALRLPSLDEVFMTLTGHPAEDESAADIEMVPEGSAA